MSSITSWKKISILYFIFHSQLLFVSSLIVDGKIWNERQKEFVLLSKIPEFGKFINETLIESRAFETHIFKGEIFKLIYYEVFFEIIFINSYS